MSGFVSSDYAPLNELRDALGIDQAGQLLAAGSLRAHAHDADGRLVPIGSEQWGKPGARDVLASAAIQAGPAGTLSWGGVFLRAADEEVPLYGSVEDERGRLALMRWQQNLVAAKEQAASSAAPQRPAKVDLGPRERNTLLKLVLGMAIDGYGHDPKGPRGPAPAEIARCLSTRGFSITDDTIRKYLQEAYQDGLWDEAADSVKPNSV